MSGMYTGQREKEMESDDNRQTVAELFSFILTHCLFTAFKCCILDAKENNLYVFIAYSLINLR